MKICALTMVYRDYWALRQWYRHYGDLVGAQNLYIVAHGPDPVCRHGQIRGHNTGNSAHGGIFGEGVLKIQLEKRAEF